MVVCLLTSLQSLLSPPSLSLQLRACAKERLEVVQCLLSGSSSEPLPNLAGNESPIHMACERGNHKIASALLEHSAKLIFAAQSENKTPLHIACSKGDLQMVKIMAECIRSLVRGNDKELDPSPLDAKDKLGRTPFFIACYYAHIAIVRELCQLKEDVGDAVTLDVNSSVFDSYRTPLHAAVTKGSLEIVELLLSLEDTKKDVEARPSQNTHEKFLNLIETRRHGRILSPTESDSSSIAEQLSPTDTLIRPISIGNFRTQFTESTSSLCDTGNRSQMDTRGQTEHTETSASQPRSASIQVQANFTLPPRKSSVERSGGSPSSLRQLITSKGRSVSDVSSQGETRALGIFESSRDELMVGVRGPSSGKTFNQLMLTPLAEACALGHDNIAEALLKYGSCDESGLACRIAHLTQSYEIMHHILTRYCFVLKEKIDRGNSTDMEHISTTAPGLQLSWNAKKLSEVKGEWFKSSAVYSIDEPAGSIEQNDDGTDTTEIKRNLRRTKPLQLRQLTLTEMPIREMNLSKNNLKSLPLEIFYLEHLKDLSLSHNRLVMLPEPEGGEWRCSRLENLNLSHNSLLHLPACVWMLPNLRKICVAHNKLTSFSENSIPKGEVSKVLSSIDLSNNSLSPTLPDFIFEFPSLKKAYLYKNKLSCLPHTMWLCPTLQELELYNNELKSLPWCEPHKEPESAGKSLVGDTILQQSDQVLTGVVQLNAATANNPFSRQKSSLYRSIRPTGIQELSWVNYSAVNTESYDYSDLKKLDVSHNHLTAFPEALPCLAPNLTELKMTHNPIRFIDLQHVPQSMKKLNCRNCEVELVGNVISPEQFKQTVRMCHGPVEIFQGKPCQHRNHARLNHLISFNLGYNRIKHFQLIHHRPYEQRKEEDPGEHSMEKEFQASLSSLDLLYPALENLDLSHNDLRGLFNPNIGHQSHLKSIKLHSNSELERIPFQFSCLKKSKDFTELTMTDLPKLYEPPKEYQKAGLSHVLTYMRSCLKE